MDFSDSLTYINSAKKHQIEYEKTLFALIYRLSVLNRCEAKEFPEFEKYMNELEGIEKQQPVKDMAESLKGFAKKNKRK